MSINNTLIPPSAPSLQPNQNEPKQKSSGKQLTLSNWKKNIHCAHLIGSSLKELSNLKIVRISAQNLNELKKILDSWLTTAEHFASLKKRDFSDQTLYQQMKGVDQLIFLMQRDVEAFDFEKNMLFVAKDPAGEIHGAMQLDMITQPGACLINNVFTSPNKVNDPFKRIKGVGTFLVNQAARISLIFGKDKIKLDSFGNSKQFYEKLGFITPDPKLEYKMELLKPRFYQTLKRTVSAGATETTKRKTVGEGFSTPSAQLKKQKDEGTAPLFKKTKPSKKPDRPSSSTTSSKLKFY